MESRIKTSLVEVTETTSEQPPIASNLPAARIVSEESKKTSKNSDWDFSSKMTTATTVSTNWAPSRS